MSQNSQQPARLAGPALFLYAVVLLIGTHLPGDAIQDSFSRYDKILHFTAYAVFTLLAFNFMSGRSWGLLACCLLIFVCLAVFAAFDELTQIPIPGRYGEWRDYWADLTGISVALSSAALLALYRRSRLTLSRRIANERLDSSS